MTKKKINLKPDSPWEITCDRYVGFLDIMGFKDWIAREKPEKVYDIMIKIRQAIEGTESVFSYLHADALEEDQNVDFESIVATFKIMSFSDSIVIFTRSDSRDDFRNLAVAMAMLSQSLFSLGVPFKGTIAHGNLTVDQEKSIFFGQPLIDAFLMQDELQYYGIALHASAEFNGYISDSAFIIEYNCPFKSGSAKHYTVTPGINIKTLDQNELNNVRSTIEKLKSKTSGALRKYIDSTLAYLYYLEITVNNQAD